MQRLVAWWVRNQVAANLLMLGIVISGWLGLQNVEKESFPGLNSYVVQIDVAWPGASPSEVEQQVVQRIEDALDGVPNVNRIRSESREGYGGISVETLADVDINGFTNDVKNAAFCIDVFFLLGHQINWMGLQVFQFLNE